MPHRQTWAFAIGKFMTDPIWWLYLFWLPDFLHRMHHIDLKGSALPIFVIYLIADVGSIGGGWLSSALIKSRMDAERGAQDGDARARAVRAADHVRAAVSSMWLAVVLVSIAASAHQGWSANIFTFSSDMFPRRAVGSVVGFGGMAGAVGGMFITMLGGYILQWHRQLPAGLHHGRLCLPAALGIIHLLVPTIKPVTLDE